MADYAKKMTALGARPERGRIAATSARLDEFESKYEVVLPAEYRRFLEELGAMHVSAAVDIEELTPFGQRASVDKFFGFLEDRKGTDLPWAMDVVEGHGLVVPIAQSTSGSWFLLVCSDQGRVRMGQVLLRDHEQRHDWTDAHFASRFKTLAPSIERYLAARRRNELGPPASGVLGYYVVGSSFDDFLDRCYAAPAAT